MNTTQIQAGTIYKAAWGYDQTTVDYYEVIKTTPKTLTLRPISKKYIDQETVEPIPGKYTGEQFRRNRTKGNPIAVNINDCETAYPWDGFINYESTR